MADGDWAVVTRDLRKTYRGRPAVDGLDLRVPARGVHGFLGPNGSGKTTTIRMLLGLVRADSGRMRIFGRSVPRSLPEVVDRVGAIVESPKFLPSFSGRRNLDLLAQAIDAPRGSLDDGLERPAKRARAGAPCSLLPVRCSCRRSSPYPTSRNVLGAPRSRAPAESLGRSPSWSAY